jgi:transketolase
VEDNYVGGIGSELAETAAATKDAPQVRSLAVHRIPKSGRTPDDVLGYVHLAISDIVDAAGELAARKPARSAVLVTSHGK